MMELHSANSPSEQACENCGAHTNRRYELITEEKVQHLACPHCIDHVLREYNDGRYGLKEWNEERSLELEKPQLKHIIETEFLRTGLGVPKHSALTRQTNDEYNAILLDTLTTNAEQPIELVSTPENNHHDTTNEIYTPTPERKYELIKIHNLEDRWEIMPDIKKFTQRQINKKTKHTVKL